MTPYGHSWNQNAEDDEFDPPNGTYRVQVHAATVFAGKDGREWCKVNYRILDGEHTGRIFEDFGAAGEHNKVGWRITSEKLTMLGLRPPAPDDELEDVDAALGEIVGVQAEVGVTHKDGFKNVTVRSSRTGQSDIPPTTPIAPVAPKDDDVPF